MRNKLPPLAYEQAVENHRKEVEKIYKKAERSPSWLMRASTWVGNQDCWLMLIPFGLVLAVVMTKFTRWYLSAKGTGLSQALLDYSLWGVWAAALVASCLLFVLLIFAVACVCYRYGEVAAPKRDIEELVSMVGPYPRLQEQIKQMVVGNQGLGLSNAQCRIVKKAAMALDGVEGYEKERLEALEALEKGLGVVGQARAVCHQERLEKTLGPIPENPQPSVRARL